MGTKKTDLVANFEATPQVKNNAAELHGVLRTAHGTVELDTGDSDNDDIVMLAPIPSNAAVPSLFIGSDTFGGSCTFNVGIYTTDGSVKDEDVFATDVADAAAMADVRFEAANIDTAGKKMYELAGDSSDPGGYFYIAATFSAAENQTAIGTVTATDLGERTYDEIYITFTISGSDLAITSRGVLSFVSAPDFETQATYTCLLYTSDAADE